MPRPVIGLVFALCGWLAATSCKSACPGVVVDGECQKKCLDSACASGTLCVDNACRPRCTGKLDCGPEQSCAARVSDNGERGSFCVGPNSPVIMGAQVGTSCTSNGDCAESFGVHCIDRTCTFTCEVHDDCVSCNSQGRCKSIGSCTGTATDSSGNVVRTCKDDSFPRDFGQFGSSCPNGPESGDCDKAFTCRGSVGNIDAYCTKEGCGSDVDCPSGYFCATTRTGTTKTQVCLKRRFCSPCESDADCLGVRNQVCAKDMSGEKICTVLCDDNINSCPWGSASTCRTTDDSIGKPTCSHRFGSCHGTGKSCEPCVDERDCPTGICASEQFTNERFCVDEDVSCTCPSSTRGACVGGGCPLSPPPAGSPMLCYGGTEALKTSLAGLCVGAATGPGCWPPN